MDNLMYKHAAFDPSHPAEEVAVQQWSQNLPNVMAPNFPAVKNMFTYVYISAFQRMVV